MAQTTEDEPGLEIDWLKTIAGALAAVTTAVLLSTLGAVGTLIGAALGSVGATVGSALYAQGLARSRQAVRKAQETALHKVGVAQAEVRRAARRDGADQEAHLDLADERLAQAKEELGTVEPTWRDRAAALGWKRVALVAAGTFVAVVLAITAFEALSGRSVSSYTGGSDKGQGTTIGGVTEGGGQGGDQGGDRDPQQGPGPSEPPASDPTEQPSEDSADEPTAEPAPEITESPSPTDTPTPSDTPTPTGSTPSGAPTQAPSGEPSP